MGRNMKEIPGRRTSEPYPRPPCMPTLTLVMPGVTQCAGASVLADRRIGVRPCVDAAIDVVDLGEAELAEVFGGLPAATAAVAEEGERRVLRQCLEARQVVAVQRFEAALEFGER